MDVYDPLVFGLLKVDVHCYVRTRPTDASTGKQQTPNIFFYLIILSILVLFYKCFLNQNCYRSLHLSAVGLGVNYVYFTIMISKNRFTAAKVLLLNLD